MMQKSLITPRLFIPAADSLWGCHNPKQIAALVEYQATFTRYLEEVKTQYLMFKRVHGELRTWGFDNFGFMLLRNAADAEEHVWSYPDKDRGFYINDKLYKEDLVLASILSNMDGLTQVTQSQIAAKIGSAKEKTLTIETNEKIIRGMKQFDVYDYYDLAVPVSSPRWQGKAVLSVTIRYAKPVDLAVAIEKSRPYLIAITRAICHVGSTKFRVNFDHNKSEVLQPGSIYVETLDKYAKNDISLAELAEMCGVTLDAVKVRLAKVRRALGVKNTNFAITKAYELGILEIRRRDY